MATRERKNCDAFRSTHAELDQRRDLNAYLLDEAMLDQAHKGTEAVQTAMAAYAEDPEQDAAQLDTAVAHTAQLLTQLRTWPQPPADTATKATKAAADRFHSSVDEMLGTLRERADGLAERLGEIDEETRKRTKGSPGNNAVELVTSV